MSSIFDSLRYKDLATAIPATKGLVELRGYLVSVRFCENPATSTEEMAVRPKPSWLRLLFFHLPRPSDQIRTYRVATERRSTEFIRANNSLIKNGLTM